MACGELIEPAEPQVEPLPGPVLTQGCEVALLDSRSIVRHLDQLAAMVTQTDICRQIHAIVTTHK